MKFAGKRYFIASLCLIAPALVGTSSLAQGMRWPVSSDSAMNPTFPIGRCSADTPADECTLEKHPELEALTAPMNTMCSDHWAKKRTPVYRTPSSNDPPFFYLPRNSRACIEGNAAGWGVFSRYIAERFNELLQEAAPDENMQYGWVPLEGMEEDKEERNGPPCTDLPPSSTPEDYFGCRGGFENVSSQSVVAFLRGYPYEGSDYKSLMAVNLNQCLKGCRDDAGCVGFTYSTANATCQLKNSGAVRIVLDDANQSPPERERLDSVFSGVKLVH
jgi:hypothetical protein